MANPQGVIRRPAVPPPVRIRRDVKTLALNDPIITFYGKAVAAMKNRSVDDPLSWIYQGSIHDFPLPEPNIPNLPADRSTFWRQCQHMCWFFLPWHRMYLHHFEKIVAAHIAQMDGGPKDWALPYWSWDAPDGIGRIPIALRNERLDDGTPNPLFVPQRNQAPGRVVNNRDPARPPQFLTAAIAQCLAPDRFEGDSQFGGRRRRYHGGVGDPPIDANRDVPGMGVLEGSPHGTMHTGVGGDGGLMTAFTTAALDPIFWMHHCNIDRFWEIWIQRRPGNVNPDDAGWLGAEFPFHSVVVQSNGRLSTGNGNLTVRDILNTRTAPLSYEYDDTTDPTAGP